MLLSGKLTYTSAPMKNFETSFTAYPLTATIHQAALVNYTILRRAALSIRSLDSRPVPCLG